MLELANDMAGKDRPEATSQAEVTAPILHITTRASWAEAKRAGYYTSPSLNTEGFIHFSAVNQAVEVANFLYWGRTDLVLLCVAPDKLTAELKVEAFGTPEPYPHLYGPLNLSAVVSVLEFSPSQDGTFQLPTAISSSVTP